MLSTYKNHIDRLRLPLMSRTNKSRMQTAFTISIEARKGITTGISAYDRARTIKTSFKTKKDIVSPGHVFPLVARPGGVLERAGHTEASIDISKLSNLIQVLSYEVMNEDGRMARLKDLQKFSKKHKIKIASIENLIAYRLRTEKLISKTISKNIIFNKQGLYEISVYINKLNNSKNYVIKKGKISSNKAIRIRVISTHITNFKNIYNNMKVKRSLKYLSKFSNFLLIVINNKENKKDMIERESAILRYYGIGAQIIKDFKVKKMILITRTRKNNWFGRFWFKNY